MKEIKITFAIDYPQKECPITKEDWTAYRSNVLDTVRKELCTMCGGYSEIVHTGGYTMQDTKELVLENSVTFITLVKELGLKYIAQTLKELLYQESVLYIEHELTVCEFV